MKILLAIDGSTDGDAAVDEVARLPWPPDSEVKVLTVIEMPIFPTIDPPWPVYLDEVEQAFRERAEARRNSCLNERGSRRFCGPMFNVPGATRGTRNRSES